MGSSVNAYFDKLEQKINGMGHFGSNAQEIEKVMSDREIMNAKSGVSEKLTIKVFEKEYPELSKEFKQIQPKKKSSGIRKFTPADIENIQLIHHLLKEKGMTIEGVKNHLNKAKDKEKSKLQLMNRLEKIKSALTALRDNL